MKRFILLGVFGLLGVVSACGGDSDDSGGSATDCKSAARSLCSKLQGCADILVTGTYGDVDTCAERVSLECTAQLGAAGSNVDESDFAKCANAITATNCEALFNNVSPPECQIPGSLDDGAQCGFGSQCKSSTCVATSSNCGTCTAVSPAGGACTSNATCEDGLVCSAQVCAQPVAAGGACTASGQCSGLLVCTNGTCAQPGAAGADCTPTAGDCDVAQGLFCSPFSSKCEKPGIAKAGEPCGLVSDKLTICGSGGSCEGATGTAPGTCVAPAADGAACNATEGPDCLAPAECVGGLCTLPAAC